ncbi:MAG: ATP-binding cassette domain-containing protein [Candidatus Babeliales bacterium]|nr:ATP-binding cassette domain-containing protein [Candidatus Babeliales bacterium]
MILRSGQIAFLLGESGAGKSTLLRILNNLESYDNGTITLNDKVLDKTNINKAIGIVFQHFNLFPHLTVEKNITLALEKVYNKSNEDAHKIAQELLAKYKLENKSSLSIDTLSGGQKQRLAIARALAINPYVICLDEPTSALDPLLTNYVAQQIQELANENRIVIVSTHDMNLVLNENIHGIIYLMKEGNIIEKASTKEVKTNPEKFKYLINFVKGKSDDN